MSDKVALAVGELLVKHGVIEHAGEVMVVALAQRKTGRARATMMDYAKKVLATVPSKAANTLVVFVAALWLLLPARDVQAAGVGGAGR